MKGKIHRAKAKAFDDSVFGALLAGADGYAAPGTPPKDLLMTLREACADGAPMTIQIVRRIVDAFREMQTTIAVSEPLTMREREVLDLLAQGCLYKEIADQLQISYSTVSTHLEHIYEKLQVHSRTQAVAKYLRRA